MKIAVVGLGLIGGSICKTLKKCTDHTVYGYDIDSSVIDMAIKCNAIDFELQLNALDDIDLTFVCLHPNLTIDFILNNKYSFKKGSIVADVCGVKKYISDAVEIPLCECGVNFVGTHPMAGRQFSGFKYTTDTLFDGASFIITKTDNTDEQSALLIRDLAKKMGFGKIVTATCDEHDRNIAFTSQLAHVVSNAYIKSPTALMEYGFSAGSFLDLTRVAYLNASMWTELFMANSENLSNEIGIIIDSLKEYKDALDKNDACTLKDLLQKGSDIKEQTLK